MVKMDQFLFKPINPSIVSIYRIIFGCFMCYQMIVYYNLDYTYQFMAGPEILFPYRGLEFMQPLPIFYLKIIHFLLLVSSLLIILGIWYRYAIVFFFIGFTYFSFIDITLYNNHIYLFSLISFVMIFLDADILYSLRRKKTKKKLKNYIPAWNQYLLIFLISLPYFFGGIAKLSSNWLHTDLTKILYNQSNSSLLYDIIPENVFIFLIKYGGLTYDFMIVFLLLNKKTRKIGIALVIIFNITNNSLLFNDIGAFPLLMICSTILFFDSSKVSDYINTLLPNKTNKTLSKKEIKLAKRRIKKEVVHIINSTNDQTEWTKKKKATALIIGVFILFQITIPFRHFLLSNNPEWTGLGSRFAWRMKMQTKEIIDFKMSLIDRSNNASGNIEAETYLTANQLKHIAEDPHNFIILAKYLYFLAEKDYNMNDPKITVDLKVKFNGLETQNLIAPNADLVNLDKNTFAEKSWILPLKKN